MGTIMIYDIEKGRCIGIVDCGPDQQILAMVLKLTKEDDQAVSKCFNMFQPKMWTLRAETQTLRKTATSS